jgi:catechol 2,3-dioxygenase-like lactoylglutathione lyase family enzyme
MRLHHVQVACPAGGEEVARRFYVEGLGMTEVEKPSDLRARGGLWVRDAGGAEIHVGVEEPFTPARKAHPALLLGDVDELDALADRLRGLGYDVDTSQRETFSGHLRFHTFDGHQNRVEVMAPA